MAIVAVSSKTYGRRLNLTAGLYCLSRPNNWHRSLLQHERHIGIMVTVLLCNYIYEESRSQRRIKWFLHIVEAFLWMIARYKHILYSNVSSLRNIRSSEKFLSFFKEIIDAFTVSVKERHFSDNLIREYVVAIWRRKCLNYD